MKFNRVFTLFIVFVLMVTLVPVAAAQGPAGEWVSGIACQNLDNVNVADITLHFYPEDTGSSALDYPDTIDAGGSKNYYTPNLAGLTIGFLGSVVIESSTPLACNVNTQTTGTGTAELPYRIGTSAGFGDTQTGTTMYAPQVMRNLAGAWSSYLSVQNATADPVDVTVTYTDRSGAPISGSETATIPGYANHVFYQADSPILTDGFLGAATVAGTGNIALTVNMYNSGVDSGTSQLLSYNGFGTGATNLLVPRFVRNFYGYNSGLSIQNIGANATTVTIDFSFAGTTYSYTSAAINPGAALSLYSKDIAELLPVDSLAESQRFGSALIISNAGENIIAIVNEDNRGGEGVPAERIGQGTTYNAFLLGTETATMFAAQVVNNAGGVFSGGFQVMNTTAGAGSCTATFGTSGVTFAIPLAANGSASVYVPNVPGIPNPYNGPVSVACDVTVVGISNLAAFPGSGKLGDSFTQGNALNR